MPNLTFTQEIVVGIWREGELIAIERKNGHLERYMVQPASWGDTTALFEVDPFFRTIG
jgi:hypothetical protein